MKSQGTIRPEVSLSLTFTSRGDDIQEIDMGSGMIINEREKEPLKALLGEKGALGSAAMWKFIQGTEISAGHLTDALQ